MNTPHPTPKPVEAIEQSFSWARDMLRDPKETWPKLAAIDISPERFVKEYLVYVLAIPAVVTVVTQGILWYGGTFTGAVIRALYTYLASLGTVFVAGRLMERFAPSFGLACSRTTGELLFAFASLPLAFASVLLLVPWVGSFAFLFVAIFSVYAFYIGFGILTGAPPETHLRFFVAYIAMIAFVLVVLAIFFEVLAAVLDERI